MEITSRLQSLGLGCEPFEFIGVHQRMTFVARQRAGWNRARAALAGLDQLRSG
jgi:hypothetical protein